MVINVMLNKHTPIPTGITPLFRGENLRYYFSSIKRITALAGRCVFTVHNKLAIPKIFNPGHSEQKNRIT